jgi:hypothetical protein
MAAAVRSNQKNKLFHHVDRNPRDQVTGMSSSTKRHFDHVKRKMLAFVGHQQTMEFDGTLVPPLHHFRHHPPPPPPPPIFVDQNKALNQPSHHRTPAPPRKHLHVPVAAHNQLPHLALATPQVGRRKGKPGSIFDERQSPIDAIF